MSVIQTAAEAAELNRTGQLGPYRAANGHLMVAPLRFPLTTDGTCNLPDCSCDLVHSARVERDYRVGDEVRYDSFAAWCADSCDHSESGPAEDW